LRFLSTFIPIVAHC